METDGSHEVGSGERSGVLHPANLERFSAQWVPPSSDVRQVVDTYWAVRWHLDENESIEQRIVDHPSITLSIERGTAMAPFVVSAVRAKAWTRTITGAGDVFALRLRPAGLAVLTDLNPRDLTPEQELTEILDARAYRLLTLIADTAPDVVSRARKADLLIREALLERPLTKQQRLANTALDLLTEHPDVRPAREIAAALHVGERTLQRALTATVGRGPNEVARRVRLQEVVRRLSADDVDLPTIAADLGYTDQAHLTNEFRAVTGVTPGSYRTATRRSDGTSSQR